MIQAIDLILQLAEKNIRIYVEEGKLKLNDPNKNINEDMLATIKLHKQALIKYLSDDDEKYFVPRSCCGKDVFEVLMP